MIGSDVAYQKKSAMIFTIQNKDMLLNNISFVKRNQAKIR